MSPDYPANAEQRSKPGHNAVIAAMGELTRRNFSKPDWDFNEEAGPEEAEINNTFRRKLAALRRLPRHERPHMLRVAREWRTLAFRALREKRDANRHAKYMLRKLQQPVPR